MSRLCADFDSRITPLGFKKTGRRLWTLLNEWSIESIHLHRMGSSYGAPHNASVDIRIELRVRVLNDPDPSGSIGIHSDAIRRQNGYAYHHRFNAQTWSTYERCVDELALFISEFAVPWFEKWRSPERLMSHPELRPATRNSLSRALAGQADPDSIAASLRSSGIKNRKRM
jgi:hypothetical protein